MCDPPSHPRMGGGSPCLDLVVPGGTHPCTASLVFWGGTPLLGLALLGDTLLQDHLGGPHSWAWHVGGSGSAQSPPIPPHRSLISTRGDPEQQPVLQNLHQPGTPKLAGDPPQIPARTPWLVRDLQNQLGTSSKVKGSPNIGQDAQHSLGCPVPAGTPMPPGDPPQCYLETLNAGWGPPKPTRDPNTGWGRPTKFGVGQHQLGCPTLAGVPSAGQDPQCHLGTPMLAGGPQCHLEAPNTD